MFSVFLTDFIQNPARRNIFNVSEFHYLTFLPEFLLMFSVFITDSIQNPAHSNIFTVSEFHYLTFFPYSKNF